MYPCLIDINFSEYSSAEGINHSALEHIQESPLAFRDALETERKPTRSMRIGSATHHAVLEPENLWKHLAILPKQWTDYKTNAAKEWRNKMEARDIMPVTPKEIEEVRVMARSIRNHDRAAELLQAGKAEQSIFHIDPETGLLLKARLDFIPDSDLFETDAIPVVDLKSARSITKESFAHTARILGYHRQAAYYLDAANAVGLKRNKFIFIVVKNSPPYDVAVYQLDEKDIIDGRKQNMDMLRLARECLERNEYPGYSNEIQTLSLQSYATNERSLSGSIS